MTMLNLLRPHRRIQSTSTQDSPQQPQQQQQHHGRSHAQSMSTIHLLLPSQRHSASPSLQASLDPSTATTLPPLNFGSLGLLGSTSPNGFLDSTLGDLSNQLPPIGSSATTAANSSSSKPTPAVSAAGPVPRMNNSNLTNKALPLLPSALQTSQSSQPLQPPSSPPQIKTQSRPGTGGSGKGTFLHGHSGLLTAPQPPPPLADSGNHGRHKEKEKDKDVMHASQTVTSGHHKRNHTKLNLLNPMALLMRRRGHQGGSLNESSRRAGARELPEDFDPGIIYATRHPDWSSPGPKRPPVDVVNRPGVGARALSPALAGMVPRAEGEDFMDRQRTPLFKECFEDNTTPTLALPAADPSKEGNRSVTRTPPQQQNLAPPDITSPQIPQTPQALTLASPSVSLGTTLVERSPPVDLPPALTLTDIPAVLTPTKSSASYSSSSSSQGSSDGEYSNIRRKGVTLVDHPLTLPRHLSSSRFSFEVSSTADSSHGEYSPGIDDEDAGGTSTKIGTPSPTKQGGIGLGLLGVGRDYRRQYQRRVAPRWGDNDGDEDVVDLASYENEDDDLYYDDGIILGDDYSEEQGFVNDNDKAHHMESARLALGGLPAQLFPEATDSKNDLTVETSSLEQTFGGMRCKDGPTAFPPFVNPIGGGMDYQKQLENFYSPHIPRTNMHGLPLALSTLNQSLCRIQQQQLLQQQDSDELDSPAPGFGNEVDPGYIPGPEEAINFDDDPDMDDPMVAAANAEALEYDTEGEYGQEFGFYSANNAENVGTEQLFAGGYFGEPGASPLRPFLVRRPSLTPISERSECSYRNSMVFGFDTNPPGSRGGGGAGIHPLALSQNLAGSMLDVAGEGGEDLGLSHLLKLRRSWAGGSQAGSIKSAPGSPGGRDTGNLGGQSPVVSSSSSPVTGPGQGPGLGQLGMSPGGLGLSPGGYGLYKVPEWDLPPVGSISIGGMNLTGMNIGVGMPVGGVGGLPLVSGMGALAPGTLGALGPGNMNTLNSGGKITQQVDQVNINNTANTSTMNLNSGFGNVHPTQLYTALLNNAQAEVSPYPFHLHKSMLGSQLKQQQGHIIKHNQHPHVHSQTLLQQQDSQQQVVQGEDQSLKIEDGNNDPGSINLPALAISPAISLVTGLAREPSAGKESTAGDSSYASAFGSPTSEAEKWEGRVSLDEVVHI